MRDRTRNVRGLPGRGAMSDTWEMTQGSRQAGGCRGQGAPYCRYQVFLQHGHLDLASLLLGSFLLLLAHSCSQVTMCLGPTPPPTPHQL